MLRLAPILASLGATVALSACVSVQPPSPSAIVVPGQGKNLAAFQQDDLVCQRHAIAHTGYAGETPGGLAGGENASAPIATEALDEVGYAQCMAARGNIVQPGPPEYAIPPDLYGNGYVAGFPYGYPYGFGSPEPVFTAGFGWGGRRRGGWGHNGFVHGGFSHGGFSHGGAGRGGGGHH
jgi:hypothetical protein